MTNKMNLQETIRLNIEQIRKIVQVCSTESVVGYSMMRSLKGFPQPGLSSPAKQIRFLLGVMLETQEPSNPIEFTNGSWNQFIDPAQRLVHAYMSLYLPTEGDSREQPAAWSKSRQVAMTAFLDYHQKGLLASSNQISDRIRAYLGPFDEQLSGALGISASDALQVAWDIASEHQGHLDRVARQAANLSETDGSLINVAQAVDRLGKTRLSHLIGRYGSVGQRFWNLFTVCRGEGPQIKYPTEPSIVETKPFIRLSDDEAVLFDFNILLSAILLVGEEELSKGPDRKRYFRMRDRTLEDHTAAILHRILGSEAKAYRDVFETPDNQHQHDLVILTSDLCLFVEVKASPPDEPFRDPEKAFVRLKRRFRSDIGIQKAYDQSLRLLGTLRERELVLYDDEGAEVLHLDPSIAGNAFCVCVTRDSFGPQATFLSLLLSKGSDDPYPWAVNILDLEQIADAWEYFGWDARQLKSFLSQRLTMHDKVFSDDELDFVGAYIRHCGLNHFARSDYDFLPLLNTYALIFDDIYFHKYHGQPRVSINPRYPILDDLGESMRLMRLGEPIPAESSLSGRIKIGRNNLCICGSGVKFKRCHGQ